MNIDYVAIAIIVLIVLVIFQFSINQDLKRKNTELRQLITIDPLTGCLNRRHFDRKMKKLSSSFSGGRHKRKSGIETLSLLYIDIDHFKKINDSLGHDVGDVVLQHVVTLLQGCLYRDSDELCRIGGEEFVAIFPDISRNDLANISDRMLHSVSTHDFTDLESAAGVGRVTVSIGVAIASNAEEAELLQKHSDIALFHAKENGRNKIVFFEDI